MADAPPVVTGSATAGQRLTCTTGTWSGDPTAYAYRWLGASVDGAATQSVITARADGGRQLRCGVIASNAAGSATATSAPFTVAAGTPSAPAPAPPSVAAAAPDRRPPILTVTSRLRVLRVGGSRAARRRARSQTVLRLRLDEPARVVVGLRICRSRSGTCRPKGDGTKRTLKLAAGRPRVRMSDVRRSGLPQAGRYELRLAASDAARNRAPTQRFVLRIVVARRLP